jgi:hypothetical protein
MMHLHLAAFHGMIGTIRHQQGIRMRKLLPAIVFGTVIAATPALAARCGGDFNGFVQNFRRRPPPPASRHP